MASHWMAGAPTDTWSQWVAKTSDGYYGIAHDLGRNVFVGYHIEALWATPKRIDEAVTLALAKQICDDHRRRPPED